VLFDAHNQFGPGARGVAVLAEEADCSKHLPKTAGVLII
jgi:hypothetical protein